MLSRMALSASDQVPPINPDALLEEIGGDRDLFRTLIQTARHDLPESLSQLRMAAAQVDCAQMRQIAHSMKTTLAHWQAADSLGLARQVELLCRQEQLEQALILVPKFDGAVREVLAALAKLEVTV